MLLKKISLLFCLLLIGFYLHAQETTYNLKGLVLDNEQKLPLPNVSVAIKQNSIVIKQGLTNEKGFFVFENLSNGMYDVVVSFIGFKTQVKKVEIKNIDVFTDKFYLTTDETLLKELKVNEVQTRVEQKGDTTEIKANAFKTNPDASAEDLIKKMPGITTENGVVKAQGEEVKKVLIDGKEFFGDDPSIALKNIPANMIEKVQVFDKNSDKSSFTGFDDGSGQKTINIITNSSKRKGLFGKAYAGYGYKDVYQTGGSVNKFNNAQKISVIAMSNNINEQNFSMQDIAGVAGASSGGGMRGGGGGGFRGGDLSNFMVNNQNGIATTHAAGINYIDQYGKKITINSAYFINYSELNNTGSTERTYLAGGDRAQHYLENNHTKNFNTNHRFNLKFGFNPDSANQIIYNPRIGFQLNSSYLQTQGETDISQFLLNRSINKTSNLVTALSYSNTLLWMHKFNKPGRTFSIELNQDNTQRKPQSNLISAASYFGYNAQDTAYNQLSVSPNNSKTYGSSISYTESIFNKYNQLEFTFNPRYTEAITDRQSHLYNPYTDTYSILQPALSNLFNNRIQTHNEGINYRYAKNAFNLSFGAAFQGSELQGEQQTPYAYSIDKHFYNVLPNARIIFKPNKQHSLRMFYRTDVSLPSASQLQMVVDNSNPILLSIGNKNLMQSFNQRLNMRYNYVNPTNAHNAFVMAGFNNAYNYISNSTLILKNDSIINGVLLKRGSQLSSPININGYYSVRSFGNYSLPVKFIKCNFNLNAGYTFSKTPTVINQKEYFTLNNNYNGGVSLSSNISEKIDFNIGPNLTYAQIISNGLKTTATNYYITQVSGKAQWIFYKGFFIHANGTYYNYQGLGAGYNVNYALLNGGVGAKFFKNNSGELRLMIFDILNQNNSINRTTTETYTEDSKNLVLKRYYMLTFTYTFKKFSVGSQPPEADKPPFPMPGGGFPFPGGGGPPHGSHP